MADLLGTALSVGNGLSQTGQSSTDLLLAAFRRTKQGELDALKSKQSALESRQVFFAQLRTRLQALQGKADEFKQSGAAANFSRYKAVSSDAATLGVTAANDALAGTVSVKVERLASNDTLAGDRRTLTGAYAFAGTTKTIIVGGTTAEVTFAADDTNETALKRIATAFNNAANTTVSVAFIKDTTTTGRLTFSVKNTGAANQLTFTDGDVLADIGVTAAALNPGTAARTTSTAASAGFRLADGAELSAKANINGVEVLRDSNAPSDILPGLTFSFQKAQAAADQPLTVTVETDAAGVADSVITPLLAAFNDVVKFLNDNTARTRGDSAVRSLQSTLRGLFGQEVTSASAGNPKFLADAGITIGSNGQLSVSKKDMLNALLKSDPAKVADLFVSADGLAAKITGAVGSLLTTDGLFDARGDSLRTQINATSNRSKQLQQRIDSQAETLRKEYQKMQKLYLEAQGQSALLNGFA